MIEKDEIEPLLIKQTLKPFANLEKLLKKKKSEVCMQFPDQMNIILNWTEMICFKNIHTSNKEVYRSQNYHVCEDMLVSEFWQIIMQIKQGELG